MFAPLVGKAQAKNPNGATHANASAGPVAAWRSGSGAVEQILVQPDIANRDFGKIPVFPPDGPGQPRAPYPLRALGRPGFIQASLVIGKADDPLEREADSVAEKVMRMPDPGMSLASAPQQISANCAGCKPEEDEQRDTVRPKLAGEPEAAPGAAPGIVYRALGSPGQPFDPQTRSFMETRFRRTSARCAYIRMWSRPSPHALWARTHTRSAQISCLARAN